MGLRPPRLAREMIRLLAPVEDRGFILGDLEDRFRHLVRTRGRHAARLWYWRQALSVLPAALLSDLDLLHRRSWTGLAGDVRLAVRTLRRRPLYAVGVAGTLGLGLAAGVLTFAVAWKVWLAPLNIPEPDRVVRLYEVAPADPAEPEADVAARRHHFSDALAVDFRQHEWQTIEDVAFVMGRSGGLQQVLDGRIYTLAGYSLPREGFEMFGISPTLGRLPTTVEGEVVLSESFWRNTLGADPDIVGKRLEFLSGFAAEIVGVAPLPSGYPADADVASVFDWRIQGGRDFRWYEMVARLRPGRSIAEAEAEMRAFLSSLAEIHPEHRGWTVDAVVLKDDLLRPFRSVIVLLLAAGTTFLLLAFVNVLGLVAARRVEGRQDRTIRLALGASRVRLLRGTVAEGVVLAGLGAVAGLLAARWLVPAVRAMVPQHVPRLSETMVTAPMLMAGLGLGLAAGVVVGLLGHLVPRSADSSSGRRAPWQPTGAAARRALVIGQVALTTLLTAGGAAILHRVSTLRAIDLGFEAEGVFATGANLGSVAQYDRSPEAFLEAMETILSRLGTRDLAAAASYNTPMSPTYEESGAFPMSVRPDSASAAVFYELHPVLGDYFSIMEIDVLAGRTFRPTDDSSSQNVVVVSEDFARDYFPGTPIAQVPGRTVGTIMLLSGPSIVAGVVRSTRHRGPDTPATPDVYIPYAQQRSLAMVDLLVAGDPDRIGSVVPDVLAEVTPGVRWSPLVAYASYLSEWYAPFRFQVIMIGALAGLGLLLASLGLYALMAYQVAIRRHEIGIRKALGATDESLRRGVILPGIGMASVGAALGLLAWYQLLPWTSELFDGLDTAGSIVPVSAILVVGLSCLVATLVPAFRATRVDPVVTVKAE